MSLAGDCKLATCVVAWSCGCVINPVIRRRTGSGRNRRPKMPGTPQQARCRRAPLVRPHARPRRPARRRRAATAWPPARVLSSLLLVSRNSKVRCRGPFCKDPSATQPAVLLSYHAPHVSRWPTGPSRVYTDVRRNTVTFCFWDTKIGQKDKPADISAGPWSYTPWSCSRWTPYEMCSTVHGPPYSAGRYTQSRRSPY